MSAAKKKKASKKESKDNRPLSGEVSGEEISRLRTGINDIDNQVLSLLAERRHLSQQVAESKATGKSPVRDPKREEQILARLIREGRSRGLDAHFVTRIFHEVIDDSVRIQQEYLQRRANPDNSEEGVIRVSFQGIEGAYSHLAAKSFFSKEVDRLVVEGFDTFSDAIRAVEEGHSDYAMLPVENTTSGSINEVYDLLLHTRLSIVGEEKYRVRHCLVSIADVPLSHLKRVYSHPQAVAQCTHFLSQLENASVEYYTDTAMSVEKIKNEGDDTQAAIASEVAAELFGLVILERDLANQKDNFTRFLVASRNPLIVDQRIPCKTSIVMATGQEPGSLAKAILVFQKYGVNLTKVESRPILGNPWEEMFYLDFEGNLEENRVRSTIEELTKTTRFIKVLGCYPSRDLLPTQPPKEALVEANTDPESSADTATESEVGSSDQSSLWSFAHKGSTTIKVKEVLFSESEFPLIAQTGPSLDPDQLPQWLREVKERGGNLVYSNSSHPAQSQLVEHSRSFQLPCILECTSPDQMANLGREADIVLVAGQNMENSDILEAVGRLHRPVILTRGHLASLDELLDSAQKILLGGNQQVILCEAGIRTFQADQKLTLDLAAIAKLKLLTHLPVIASVSRSSESGENLTALASAARSLGADGLLVSVNLESESIPSGNLDLSQFKELVSGLHQVR